MTERKLGIRGDGLMKGVSCVLEATEIGRLEPRSSTGAWQPTIASASAPLDIIFVSSFMFPPCSFAPIVSRLDT
jgi:hypothetical protein